MVRIVLTTLGTSGDFNPFLSLGLGLRARGHDVDLVAVKRLRQPFRHLAARGVAGAQKENSFLATVTHVKFSVLSCRLSPPDRQLTTDN